MNIPLELVPLAQEHILALCRKAGVFSIVATKMMESMVSNRRPTRAEVNDVYTAVRQGVDAVMLSGETAVGTYPVEAVAWMRKIAEAAEARQAIDIRSLEKGSGEMAEDVEYYFG